MGEVSKADAKSHSGRRPRSLSGKTVHGVSEKMRPDQLRLVIPIGKNDQGHESLTESNSHRAIAFRKTKETVGADMHHWERTLRNEESCSKKSLKKNLDYQALATLAYSVTKRLASDVATPKTVGEALQGCDREGWLKAIALENESIKSAGVFTLVPISKGKNLSWISVSVQS